MKTEFEFKKENEIEIKMKIKHLDDKPTTYISNMEINSIECVKSVFSFRLTAVQGGSCERESTNLIIRLRNGRTFCSVAQVRS